MDLDLDRDMAAELVGLPWDVFSQICNYLGREDILALSYTCKTVRDPAEELLLTVYGLKVKNKNDFNIVARILHSKPYLCDAVGRLWVGKDAPWWTFDLLQSSVLGSLHGFVFRPQNLKQEHARRMVRAVATEGWIPPSLTDCSIEIFYSDIEDVEGTVLDQLLNTLMSAPSLKILTATYARDLSEIHGGPGYFPLPPDVARPFPRLPAPRFTDLRELHLRWDDLSLQTLSALLEVPRNLEELHLYLGKTLSLQRRGCAFLPLNAALGPVAHSLKALVIFPTEDYSEPEDFCGYGSWSDDLKLHWGPGGLREFGRLEFLAAPSDAWALESEHRLELPRSLTRLRLIGTRLYYGMSLEESRRSRHLKYRTAPLNMCSHTRLHAQTIVDGTPRLRYLEVSPSSSVDVDDLRERAPPIYVGSSLAPIAERGIRVLVPLPDGDSVELEIQSWA